MIRELNVVTGEVTERDYTDEELAANEAAAAAQAQAAIPVDPVEKLKAFLAANPDVGAIIK